MGDEKLDVLAFAAHPDDAELGCGGTLYKLAQQGYATGIVDVTEGEMSTRGTVEERYKESKDAAKILQASLRLNLKIPDAKIALSYKNREKVVEVIRRHRPTLVFAPYPDDRHPDHIHTSHLITEGSFYAGVKKVDPTNLAAHRPHRVAYYMMTYEFTPSFVVDISEQFSTKIEALQAHRSQFYNPDYQAEETFISSRGYMEAIEFRARHFGWKAGVRYAEPFWMRETLVLENLLADLSANSM